MRSKTVVVVDDSEGQRVSLLYALENRGFRARGAGTVAEARQLIDHLGQEIDVIVLDMMLDDSSARDITGADIGIQLQAEHPNWLPEYLIQSAYSKINYYDLALRLGAAAYLSKNEAELADLIRHIRVLALRRSLRLDRLSVAESLRAISDSTTNLGAVIRKLCREVLADELNACLDMPYVLLLTDEDGTQNCTTNTDLPAGSQSIYAALQALAHGVSDYSSIYEVSKREMPHLPSPKNTEERRIYERLENSTLIPLLNDKYFRLSIGLLSPQSSERQYPEDPAKLAAALAQYVRPAIVEYFRQIPAYLDSQKRSVIIRSISRLCLFLGQDQRDTIEQGITTGHLREDSTTHHKLNLMADDLWDTGKVIADATNAGSFDEIESFEIKQLIERAIEDLKNKLYLRGIRFTVEGSCLIKARQDDVYVAIIRVMQWLAQRRVDTVSDLEPQIMVQCLRVDGTSQIIFEDRSRRLPEHLRELLFMPFSISVVPPTAMKLLGPGLYLPLYLAKMLVEGKYGGSLDDRSSEMEGKNGHKIVMRF